jgi:ankyrin repeat protein
LDAGAVVNQKDNEGRTPLHWVALFGKGVCATTTIQILLKSGADVEVKDKNQRTAFYYAATRGEVAIDIMILLQLVRNAIFGRKIRDAGYSGLPELSILYFAIKCMVYNNNDSITSKVK